jgi:hypothetical protein
MGTEPAVKKSVLAKVGELLKHPAATRALQVGLPELLKNIQVSVEARYDAPRPAADRKLSARFKGSP